MNALRRHYPEYLIEVFGLGTFMASACVVTALLEHPVPRFGMQLLIHC